MKLYNLITEATACSQWKDKTFVNGDGKKTPKITIEKTKTKVTGTYEGPEKGFCIQSAEGNPNDSVHQLAGITVFHECNPYLKELYKGGTYVRPNLKGVTLERKENYYEISIPLEKTTEDKAITSINQRGSWGGGTGGIDTTEFNSAKTRPMFYTETLISTGLSDMTEYFFCWRNLEEFPIKTKPGTETKPIEKAKEVTKPTEKSKEDPKTQPVVNQSNGSYETIGKRFFLKYGDQTVLAEVFKATDTDMRLRYVKLDGAKASIGGVFKYNKDKTAVILVSDDGTPSAEFKIVNF